MQCRERCAPIWIAGEAGQQQQLEHIPASRSRPLHVVRRSGHASRVTPKALPAKRASTHLGRLCVVCGLNWPRLRLKLAGVGRLHLQQTER